MDDEKLSEIAAHYRCAVDEGVARELSEAMEFMKEELRESLVTDLDNYLFETFSELEEKLDEENNRIATMIYLAVDSKSSEEFIAKVADLPLNFSSTED